MHWNYFEETVSRALLTLVAYPIENWVLESNQRMISHICWRKWFAFLGWMCVRLAESRCWCCSVCCGRRLHMWLWLGVLLWENSSRYCLEHWDERVDFVKYTHRWLEEHWSWCCSVYYVWDIAFMNHNYSALEQNSSWYHSECCRWAIEFVSHTHMWLEEHRS